ncbi:methyltransferase [Palleronia sp. KMU-117]|uniref:methyltransferase n=1 Tax=Palleronia sp. KMU-117 TaxID=3434108 RepID=UPI003D734ED0
MGGLVTNLDISDFTRRCIEDYLTGLGIAPDDFHGAIGEQDEMYHNAIAVKHTTDFAYFKYIESGRCTHDAMRQFYDHFFGGPDNIGSVLEFASGHGRATRYLMHYIPKERIWVSDIYADAMAFQKSYFGVNTILSYDDPDKIVCDRKFDAITAMSLFTHLPEGLFGRWLKKLASLLEDDGVLFVTAREAGTVLGTRNLDGIEQTGIVYEHTSESRTLSTDIYGMTTVTDAFMRRQIAEFISPDAQVQVFRRGLYLNQDLYAITLREPARFPPIDLKRPPTGGRADCWVPVRGGKDLYISGWAVDLNDGHDIAEVDLSVDNVSLGALELGPYVVSDFGKYFPGLENAPKAFAIRLPVADLQDDSIVKTTVRSSTGAQVEFYAPPITTLGQADPQS